MDVALATHIPAPIHMNPSRTSLRKRAGKKAGLFLTGDKRRAGEEGEEGIPCSPHAQCIAATPPPASKSAKRRDAAADKATEEEA